VPENAVNGLLLRTSGGIGTVGPIRANNNNNNETRASMKDGKNYYVRFHNNVKNWNPI
jgi:hypothetical protein